MVLKFQLYKFHGGTSFYFIRYYKKVIYVKLSYDGSLFFGISRESKNQKIFNDSSLLVFEYYLKTITCKKITLNSLLINKINNNKK